MDSVFKLLPKAVQPSRNFRKVKFRKCPNRPGKGSSWLEGKSPLYLCPGVPEPPGLS